jgi:hypothetical protein
MIINDKWVKMGKEAIITSLKINLLFWHLPRETEETHEESQHIRRLVRDSK